MLPDPQPDVPRELAQRIAEGLDVSLYWYPSENRLRVIVMHPWTGASFQLELEEDDDALDVFYHPFAYLRRVAPQRSSPRPNTIT
jgi:hypothetical protein